MQAHVPGGLTLQGERGAWQVAPATEENANGVLNFTEDIPQLTDTLSVLPRPLRTTRHQRYNKRNPPENIVVFDLDGTLGDFTQLGWFWYALKDYCGGRLGRKKFFEIIDIFPEFLRPDMIKIIKFLMKKRSVRDLSKVLIYTNNQGPRNWVRMIASYFDSQTKEKTFDQIIAAYEVNGKIVEICRTSEWKSVDDIVKCTGLPSNTEICFLDDQYHPYMERVNVNYIVVSPYSFSMPFDVMAEKYYSKARYLQDKGYNKTEFVNSIVAYMTIMMGIQIDFQVKHKSRDEKHKDKVVSSKILKALQAFLKDPAGSLHQRLVPKRVADSMQVELQEENSDEDCDESGYDIAGFPTWISLCASSGVALTLARFRTSVFGKEPLLTF
eukprot:gnl/MRDRNA2_/MRDRNA2_164322_c0_seq1.p1 gnl/MRDRNA2_/MRDRNA2_164322_c0~~gnl/MRDRNA2_/MRDRNA2_164322_c0_seq1.p1  ORF type:complete len:401 (+),score=72.95 gnl/MRDRNA2_/MRDRNA2_164322_c0_seq1:55-1203(+)